jgi:hypothetical protein
MHTAEVATMWLTCHSCGLHKLLVKNNTQVVYMHMRVSMNRILEYFLKKGNSFTNLPPLAYIKHVQDQHTPKCHWSHNS